MTIVFDRGLRPAAEDTLVLLDALLANASWVLAGQDAGKGMTVFCGIDPGQGGAVALIMPNQTTVVWDLQYAGNEPDIQWLRGILGTGSKDLRVALEVQMPMPRQGLGSTFTTGKGYGMLLGALLAMGVTVVTVRPLTWKRAMGLHGPDKEMSRQLAQRLFPTAELHLKKHHGRAEALLLAEYLRRQP